MLPDIDGDGFDDAVGESRLLLGRDWGLTYSANSQSVFFRGAFDAGDFNGDGNVDILVVNPWVVFLDDALEHIRTVDPAVNETGVRHHGLTAVPDINADGNDDLVAGSPSYRPDPLGAQRGAVVVWYGADWMTDPVADVIIPGIAPQVGLGTEVKVADINSDGHIDIITSWEQGVAVFFSEDGGFNAVPDWQQTTVRQAPEFFIGDIDGDGHLDITIRESNAIDVVRGGPTLTASTTPSWSKVITDREAFKQGWYLPHPPFHPLFPTSAPESEDEPPFLSRLLVENDVLTTVNLPLEYGSGMNVAVGDFNGDGYADAIDRYSQVPGNADGLGLPEFAFGPERLADFEILAAEDLNSDGTMDLIRRSDSGDDIEMNGTTVIPLQGTYMGVSGDVDNDGDLDILVQNVAGLCFITEFSAASAMPDHTWSCGTTVIGDVNGDGRVDTRGIHNGEAGLYLTDSSGPSVWVDAPYRRPALNVGDINGDGVDDLYLEPIGNSPVLEGWFGDPELTELGPSNQTIPLRRREGAAPAGDMNADGFADVWIRTVSPSGMLSLHLGGPTGVSTSPADSLQLAEFAGINNITTAHIPGSDFPITIISNGNNSGIWLLRADASGTLSVALHIPQQIAGSRPVNPVLGVPVDNDPTLTLLSGANRLLLLVDEDGDGVYRGTDCDDQDPNVVPTVVYADQDADGFGGLMMLSCADSTYAQTSHSDCNDGDDTVSPSAPEQCDDDIDYDCDGLAGGLDPDNDAEMFYFDNDQDGFNGIDSGRRWCDPPFGWNTTPPTDCEDDNRFAYPGAEETCNGRDSDCNGIIDDVIVPDAIAYVDEDGDGWGTTPEEACPSQDGFAEFDGDCAPQDASVNPGADEVWYDGIDQNCDGNDDDQDFDGFAVGEDCDDTDLNVNPDVRERWYDGIDQDCDGNDDDQDGDGFSVDVDCDDEDPTLGDDCDGSSGGCSAVRAPHGLAGLLLLALAMAPRRRQVNAR